VKLSERRYRPLASIAKEQMPCELCSHVSHSAVEVDSHLNSVHADFVAKLCSFLKRDIH
jgi:hypothetical protein